MRQAAVYGLGVAAEHSRALDEASLQQAAQKLIEVIDHPLAFGEDNATASDNAVSALGKVCRRSEAIAAVGLPRWLAKLPLGADKEEARAVHKTLVEMCEATNVNLLGASQERLPEIICVFGQVLDSDVLDDDIAPRIVNILRQVRQGLPHVLQALPTHPGCEADAGAAHDARARALELAAIHTSSAACVAGTRFVDVCGAGGGNRAPVSG